MPTVRDRKLGLLRRLRPVVCLASAVTFVALCAERPFETGLFVGAWLPTLSATRSRLGEQRLVGAFATARHDARLAPEVSPDARPLSAFVTELVDDCAILSVLESDGTEIMGELHISQIPQGEWTCNIQNALHVGQRITVYHRPRHGGDQPSDVIPRFTCIVPSAVLTPEDMWQWKEVRDEAVILKGTFTRSFNHQGVRYSLVQVQHPVSGMMAEGLLPPHKQAGLTLKRGMEFDVRVIVVDEVNCRLKLEPVVAQPQRRSPYKLGSRRSNARQRASGWRRGQRRSGWHDAVARDLGPQARP